MGKDFCYLSIREMSSLLQGREISSVELTRAHLSRINATEKRIGAYVTVTPEEAEIQAHAADLWIAQGKAGPLTGIPMQLKDNISTKGINTTCSSKMLENYIPRYDATVTERLKQAGTVLLGKGNMDEFAMGSSTENSGIHVTNNPWDVTRVPGGSSGGPAAAVAAGQAAFALGSDTGGSIRQPAALCGIVGMKPTYGLVSRYGLIAFASSLDQIGPLTRTVEDAAIVMNAISGHDAMDSTSIPGALPDFTSGLGENIKGLRIGLPREYFEAGIDPSVREQVNNAIHVLESAGALIEEVSLPHTKDALAVYYIIAPSECSANLARYDGVKFGYSNLDAPNIWEALDTTRQVGFGSEVKRRVLLGTYALSAGYYDAFYKKAQQVRTLISQEFEEVFQRVDLLATPTSPTVPFKQGEKIDDPVQMYLSDVCTIPANISGIPAISVPCGFVDSLPVGLQFLGPHLSETKLLKVSHAYQQLTSWHRQHPDI